MGLPVVVMFQYLFEHMFDGCAIWQRHQYAVDRCHMAIVEGRTRAAVPYDALNGLIHICWSSYQSSCLPGIHHYCRVCSSGCISVLSHYCELLRLHL